MTRLLLCLALAGCVSDASIAREADSIAAACRETGDTTSAVCAAHTRRGRP